MATRVTGMGEAIRSAWDKAGAAVGGTVMRIGYAIHQLLCALCSGVLGPATRVAPTAALLAASNAEQTSCCRGQRFTTSSSPEFSWDSTPPAEQSERVGKIMMKVAVVVMALLVFRRLVR